MTIGNRSMVVAVALIILAFIIGGVALWAVVNYQRDANDLYIRADQTILAHEANLIIYDGDKIEVKTLLDKSIETDCEMKNIKADYHVCYTNDGYIPNSIQIQAGDSVAFLKGVGMGALWTASDNHPFHTLYDGTEIRDHCDGINSVAFDQCGMSDDFIFTFTKEGVWPYHNHVFSVHKGMVYVK